MTDNKEESSEFIHITGATEHNLKNVNAKIPLYKKTVVTGPSGSGKSSLIIDTLFSEGQRRYLETLSTFTRQCLDRLDKAHVDKIDEVPPAISIDRASSIRNASSTVATLTGIHKPIRALFALIAKLYCPDCGQLVLDYSEKTIITRMTEVAQEHSVSKVAIGFSIKVPKNLEDDAISDFLSSLGFTRILKKVNGQSNNHIIVASDRFRIESVASSRFLEAVSTALKKSNSVYLFSLEEDIPREIGQFKLGLYCEHCQKRFARPTQQSFDFRLSLGACQACKGFGNIRVLDETKMIPNPELSFECDAVDLLRVPSLTEEKTQFLNWLSSRGISPSRTYDSLTEKEKQEILFGSGSWRGIDWLLGEVDKYFLKKVGVSTGLKYRKEVNCPSCSGFRLKKEALSWKINFSENENLHIGEIFNMEIEPLRALFEKLLEKTHKKEAVSLINEILALLRYLSGAGLGYLTLSRESRTLSGGELQRVNLASALGSQLVNTLFVLDEPSFGLHAKDAKKISSIIDELTKVGNTTIIIDHNPAILSKSDFWMEMGLGAGVNGGNLIFAGSPEEALKAKTPTANYIAQGILNKEEDNNKKLPSKETIKLFHARKNNLKDLSVIFPLHKLVIVTGVSGSGKSTLIGEELVPELEKITSKKQNTKITSDKDLKVCFISQKTLTITQSSSPASLLGLTDHLRKLFSNSKKAKELGLKPIDFSVASSKSRGRCSHCSGTGFERVDMQFLSERLLTCPICKGLRFNSEIQSVKITDAYGNEISYPEVLNLSANEAIVRLNNYPEIKNIIETLIKLNLGYVLLGQPLKTLSLGELQRVKLASAVTSIGKKSISNYVFIFDEPTAGLSFDEVNNIYKFFIELINRGSSVIAVDHNLGLIEKADHIIELGPVGGGKGGYLIFEGTPKELIGKDTPTAVELTNWVNRTPAEYVKNLPKPRQVSVSPVIEVLGAKEHNLKNIDARIKRGTLTVLTGPSGSGKSTLAFDIIFSEGQRRFLSTMNAYERTFVSLPKVADISSISGIPPTVAISQRTSRGGMRSTVATMTEIYPYLRLIFEKLGNQRCVNCGCETISTPLTQAAQKIHLASIGAKSIAFSIPVKTTQSLPKKAALDLISAGKKAFINGIPFSENFSIKSKFKTISYLSKQINILSETSITSAIKDVTQESRTFWVSFMGENGEYLDSQVFSLDSICPICHKSYQKLTSHHFSFNSTIGACEKCKGFGIISKDISRLIKKGTEFDSDPKIEEDDYEVCPKCNGGRLKEGALSSYWKGKNIRDLSSLSVKEALNFFDSVTLTQNEKFLIGEVISEIKSKLNFMISLGLEYLTLDRSAPTLSGGEAQRIRLASNLGSNLAGVCYVLDEPTIGLHAEDNAKLINAILGLKEKGNTVIVVEHDLDTIKSADSIIDLGPRAGKLGGQIIASGTVKEIMNTPNSETGKYLKLKPESFFKTFDSKIKSKPITLRNIKYRNLDIKSLTIPSARLVALTGKSGSGKSTLAHEVIYPTIKNLIDGTKTKSLRAIADKTIKEELLNIQVIDQSPLHGSSRSCPATYTNIWSDIREIFGTSNEAKIRGFDASRFSFNKPEGACPECAGKGYKEFTLSFLPHSEQLCEACMGERFNPETLSVEWNGVTIGDVLKMSVDEALQFFSNHANITKKLKLLSDSGLGYLELGQSSSTLSGGEGQRIKLVAELANRANLSRGKTLYILDEPTVGLHMREVDLLISILRKLVDKGHTVLVIEHNLEFIAACDEVIDLGPGGGEFGGKLIAQGCPKELSSGIGSLIGEETPTMKALRLFRES